MKNLTQEAFLDIRVGVPPLPDQVKIAAFLDKETEKLDALEQKVLSAVERLSEYRTALITAAMHGQDRRALGENPPFGCALATASQRG